VAVVIITTPNPPRCARCDADAWCSVKDVGKPLAPSTPLCSRHYDEALEATRTEFNDPYLPQANIYVKEQA